MTRLNLKTIVWKEGKYFVAQCLNIDVSSFGKTKKEVIAYLDEALELYFEDAPKRNVQKIERPEIIPMHVSYA
ncbi:type II toxin-antitoxin system HicB family antitoxin [Candidatus Uhrbacteria bacterium]|nr:type II toxin-antitoxin system HicB family antitoxin [Candidatus Uhrbacteria bacterium]